VDDLFAELKPDIESLAGPLFDVSETFLSKRGAFLPHGAVRAADGTVRMVMAAPDGAGDSVTAIDVLPRLHEALRYAAGADDLAAVAVCEDVTVTRAGQKPTKAVKVLVEHRRGLTVALYEPWHRKLLGGCEFGESWASRAEPEVSPWGSGGSA
jgi:hypothetical protein